MTYEEIQAERTQIDAERTRDYKFLGRFLGLADMAAAPNLWRMTPQQVMQRLIEIRDEYAQNFPVPTATEGSKAKDVKGAADCRPAGMEGSRS